MRRRRSRVTRWGPALVTLLAALAALALLGRITCRAGGSSRDERDWQASPPLSPPVSPLPCTPVEDLVTLSERAAGLTGGLAFVAAEERPAQAARAARQMRTLSREATRAGDGPAQALGDDLAQVLGELSEALTAYAGGEPGALAAVQAASARNAEIRQTLYDYQSTCGGKAQ